MAELGGGRAIGAAANKTFRFAKCNKDALEWLTGSDNRPPVSQLTGLKLLFLTLWCTEKRQGLYFQWHIGITLAYRQRRRSLSLLVYVVKIDENMLEIQFLLLEMQFFPLIIKINEESDVCPVLHCRRAFSNILESVSSKIFSMVWTPVSSFSFYKFSFTVIT